MPSVLKDRNPGLIFGATFAIGILLLVGAELVGVFSSGISDEQRASQAVYTAFGYQEDCDALASTPTTFWCGSLLHITTCYLNGRNAQTRYYACYDPPPGSVEGDNTGPGAWACVVDRGGETGMKLVAGRADEQNPCQWAYAKHT